MSRAKGERTQRDDILDEISKIRVEPGKALRQVEVPKSVYAMAAEFIQWAPYRTKTGALYRLRMDFIYALLSRNCESGHLAGAREKIEGWQAACRALLRYALNLLLAPKRPEFRRLKLSSSFYVYQVSKKLAHAEHILMFMGYKSIRPDSQEVQELNYEGEVVARQVLETAADLVILHSELELVKRLVESVLAEPRAATGVTLPQILKARSETTSYEETWRSLMKIVYTPPQQQAMAYPQQQLDVPAGSAVSQAHPGSQGYLRQTSAGPQYPNQAVRSMCIEGLRRGSAPVVSATPLPQPIPTRTPPVQRAVAEEDLCVGTVPPPQHAQFSHHQQPHHPRSEPPSVHGLSEPGSSFDMGVVHHDAHEKIHARSRHFRAEKLPTLTADRMSNPSAQRHHHSHERSPASVQALYQNTPLSSVAEPIHVTPGDQNAKAIDHGIYQNIGSVYQGSHATVDSEHHVQPHPYEGVHAGVATTGADGQSAPEPPSDSHLEYQTPEYNAHLSDSLKVKQVEHLFKKFPNLVPGQESENIETSPENAVYQNIPGPSRVPSAAAAQLHFKLPDPVVDTVSDLGRLAQPNIPRTSSVVSRLKNVRSVDYDTPGPEDFLSGLLSPATPQTPCLVRNPQEEAAWLIPQEAHPQPHSYPSSSGSNKDKHSPGSSLGENVMSPKRGSCSGSDSEDLYNSGPSGEFERGPKRGASLKQQIATVQEATEPGDGIVKDSVTTSLKPVPKQRSVTPLRQSVDGDTPRQDKPAVLPRRSQSGSNLLELSSSEDADARSQVCSAPSSPAALSSKSTGSASYPKNFNIVSEKNLQIPSPKPTPKPRVQSSVGSAEDKDESSLDRKPPPGARGFQRLPERREQFSHRRDKTLPTVDVSNAIAGSGLHKDSTGNSRAFPQDHEPPQKLNIAGPMRSHTSGTSVVKPEEEKRNQLLERVQGYDMKWICSYCLNVMYEPGAFKCDVCGHLKSTCTSV